MIAHQKLGQSDLLCGSKSPAEKVGMNRHFKPAEPRSLCEACWIVQLVVCSF